MLDLYANPKAKNVSQRLYSVPVWRPIAQATSKITSKLMSHNLACLSEGKPFWHGDFAFSCLNVFILYL